MVADKGGHKKPLPGTRESSQPRDKHEPLADDDEKPRQTASQRADAVRAEKKEQLDKLAAEANKRSESIMGGISQMTECMRLILVPPVAPAAAPAASAHGASSKLPAACTDIPTWCAAVSATKAAELESMLTDFDVTSPEDVKFVSADMITEHTASKIVKSMMKQAVSALW